jgi:hypothetical protein
LESIPNWIQQEVEGAVAKEEEEAEGDVTEQSLPPSSQTQTEGVVLGSSCNIPDIKSIQNINKMLEMIE